MANTLKFGNGQWATKEGSTLAYNSESGNFKPLPFTFDRSTSATRVNKEGLIEVVSNNEPRIDFLNDSKGALKLEPSRSNTITYSNDFLDSSWNVFRGSVTADVIISPDGTQNASRYEEDSQTGGHLFRRQNLAIQNELSYTGSIFIKKGELTSIILTSNSSSRWVASATFDIENGIVTSGTGVIEDYGNGWYRCSISGNAVETTTVAGLEMLTSVGAGRDGDGLYMYGAMFEQGSYATSYIPTQGSIGTRVAESCSGAGNDQVFNDSEGVIYVETQPFIDGDFTSVYISLSDNTTGTNFITIQHRDSGQLRVYAGNFSTIIFLQDIDMSENLKIALQYENITDFKLYVNGISYPIYSTPTNSAFVGLNTFDFKLRGSASGYWLGQVKEAKYFNTALTDQELISLTS